jgi:hypothetical protein
MATQDELLAGLLGGIPGGPLTQGLLATSAGLLSAGGPSYEPRSLGGALGAGMMSGLNAYQAAQQNALSQYVGATKLMQQMRQQQALTDLTQGMTPQQRALVMANPGGATGQLAKAAFQGPTELTKRINDYRKYFSDPDPLVRDAALAQLAGETPQFKALVAGAIAGASERGRFDAVSTPLVPAPPLRRRRPAPSTGRPSASATASCRSLRLAPKWPQERPGWAQERLRSVAALPVPRRRLVLLRASLALPASSTARLETPRRRRRWRTRCGRTTSRCRRSPAIRRS